MIRKEALGCGCSGSKVIAEMKDAREAKKDCGLILL